MLETDLFDLEGDRHVENRTTVLDRDDASSRKASTVANSVDLVEDRNRWIAGPKEVPVKRVGRSVLDGATRSHERLGEHLPTKYALAVLLGTPSPEEVDLDRLEIKQVENAFKGSSHGKTPARCGAGSPTW